jgi:hypothetical protein
MKIQVLTIFINNFQIIYYASETPTFTALKKMIMSYEIVGKLTAKYDTVQRTETFKTREFVIEKSEDIGGRIITNYAKFQCVQDKTSLVDKLAIGDEVKVSFNIKGTKWVKDGKENYITNLDAWRIETVKLGAAEQQGAPQESYANMPPPPPPPTTELVDDLPF